MADCLNNEEQVTSNLDSKNQDSLNSNLDTGNAITSDIVSDGVLVSNTNSGESVSSVLESGEALASQLDLPVTHTYRGAETDNIVVSVDNNAYTISATLKQIKFKTVADFPVVGSDKLLYIDATENSLYSWDSDIGEYRKLVADTGDIEIDLDDYFTKTESDTRYGASIDLSLDSSTYVITAQLKDANGNNLGVAKTIDLPLESVVVNGSYDSTTKEVVLTLDNGSEIKFSVADLVSGLQSEITATNKLASDLVDDANSVNKFVTQGEKDKLTGIEEGANKTVVDSEFSGTSTNPLQNKLITEKFRDVVWKTTDQTINSVKTFEKQPKIADSVTESMAGRYIVSAERIQKFLRENYQEILVAGNNITFDGNTISANLEGSSPIVTLTSPVVIYDLPSGMYQLPAGCELYINNEYVSTGTKVNYDNTSVALMVVASITNPDSRVDKLFYLFAEADGQTTSTVGNTGSFIVGKAKQSSGHYHITGTDIKYVELEDDGWIGGNKSFLNPVKYYHQYESLDTSLNDRTLVDAQWVKAQGYVGSSALNGYASKTDLDSKVSKNGDEINGFLSISTTDVTEFDWLGFKPLTLYAKGDDGCYIEMHDESRAFGQIGINNRNEPVFVDNNLSSDNVKKFAFKDDIPDTSAFVTETELAGKGYLTSVPSEYVTETELTNKGYATTSALNNKLNTSDLLNKVYPVGSVYMSITNTSPASFIGGTWTAIPAGYALWTATSGAGGTISAGLPNISGSVGSLYKIYWNSATFSGAFSKNGTSGKYASGSEGNTTAHGFNFNASSSNSIYGASSTVQPPAYKVYAWRRTG